MIDFNHYDLNKEIEKIKNTQYIPNDQYRYSYNKIINTICNIPKFINLSYYIYHGNNILDHELYDYGLDTPQIVICPRQSQVDYLIQRGKSPKKAFAIGAFFPLYRRFKNISQAPNAKGTIAYYAHSSHEVDIMVDTNAYIEQLKQLPEKFHPIHISMYWLDILKNRHLPFLENNFQVFTAGHANDEDFVDNFYEILRHHQYATANDYSGSNLLYCVEFGCPTFIYGANNYLGETKGENFDAMQVSMDNYNKQVKMHKQFFQTHFPTYPNITMAESSKQEIIKKLGLDIQTSPKNLRNALLKDYIITFLQRDIITIFLKYVKKFRHFFYQKTRDNTIYTVKIFKFITFSYKRKKH